LQIRILFFISNLFFLRKIRKVFFLQKCLKNSYFFFFLNMSSRYRKFFLRNVNIFLRNRTFFLLSVNIFSRNRKLFLQNVNFFSRIYDFLLRSIKFLFIIKFCLRIMNIFLKTSYFFDEELYIMREIFFMFFCNRCNSFCNRYCRYVNT
jgi:hypothetical protein